MPINKRRMQGEEHMFTESGKFLIGCNYWASHAGTHTWHDWQPLAAPAKRKASKEALLARLFPPMDIYPRKDQAFAYGLPEAICGHSAF